MSGQAWADRAPLLAGGFSGPAGRLEIPPLPQVAVRVMGLTRCEDVEFSEVATLIASDAGLATRVLRIVNAAGVGLRNQVTDVQQAISVLGLARIRDLVLAWSALDALPAEAPGFDYESHWRQALQRSIFAQSLAAHVCGGSEGEAFTGALLQDMAVPLLLSRRGREYLPVLEAARMTGRALADVEGEHLGWNHAQAGAWLARKWGFPDPLVCCIGLHNATLTQLEELELADTSVKAVAASSRIPGHRVGLSEALGLEEEQWDGICSDTDDACGEVAEMLGVPPPESLAEPDQGA